MLISRLCLLVVLAVPSAYAQTTPPTPAAFRVSLVKLKKQQIPEWKNSLQQVQIEQLPVAYAHGKLIEKARDEALRWLQICDMGADQTLSRGALGDDVLLASNMSELAHSMSDFAELLASVDLAKGSTYDLRNRWMNQIQDLAGGPINDLAQAALSFSVARADELEKRCKP